MQALAFVTAPKNSLAQKGREPQKLKKGTWRTNFNKYLQMPSASPTPRRHNKNDTPGASRPHQKNPGAVRPAETKTWNIYFQQICPDAAGISQFSAAAGRRKKNASIPWFRQATSRGMKACAKTTHSFRHIPLSSCLIRGGPPLEPLTWAAISRVPLAHPEGRVG